MSCIKGKNTKPEVKLRKLLFSKGLRGYKTSAKSLGKPDIVFTKAKVIIFVDGCFWHKCPECFIQPKTNASFWTRKINSNVKRDLLVNQKLKKEGWKVIRIWEHDIKKKNINNLASRIIKVVNGRKKDGFV